MADTAPETRPAYEALVNEFIELDAQCQEFIIKFQNGKILYDCLPVEGAPTHAEFFEKMVAKFVGAQEYVKNLIDKRNAKYQEAATAMRAAVMAADTVVRGPDGKGSFLTYGPLKVESRTFRSLNWEKLKAQLAPIGFLGRLMELTTIDKDTGQAIPVYSVVEKVEYRPVVNLLRENNLEHVLQEVYEEEEGTPAVTGPKPLGWIGEAEKTSKKGKKV